MFMWGKGGRKYKSQSSIALRPKLWKLVRFVVSFTVLASARSDKAKVQNWVYLHKWKHTLASVLFCPPMLDRNRHCLALQYSTLLHPGWSVLMFSHLRCLHDDVCDCRE